MRTIFFAIALLAATIASAQFTGAANVLNERGTAVNRFTDTSITADGNGSIVKYESVFVRLGERVKYLDYAMDGSNYTIYIQRDKENRCELTTHWNGTNLVYLIFIAWDSQKQIYDRWQWFPNCEILLRKSTATK